MTKREFSPLGYPVDRRGRVMGPEKFDSGILPTEEQVRLSHDPGWVENRLAKARKARKAREAMLARLHSLPTTGRPN